MPNSVGVVIAAHNSAATIGEALQSLLEQTFTDWEAIVVDDCSSDATVEAVAPFLTDPRIKCLRNEQNLGSGASRNRALRELRTELIAVLDADDICLPTRFERQVSTFNANPKLDVLGAQVAEFGTWGGPLVTRKWPTTHEEITNSLATRMPIAHCAVMYRRAPVMDVGGYDERLRRAQDLALMLRMKSATFGALDSVELLYRTTRPITAGYALRSGRGGYLARYWARVGDSAPTPSRGRMLLVDARSLVTWTRRALRERAASARQRKS